MIFALRNFFATYLSPLVLSRAALCCSILNVDISSEGTLSMYYLSHLAADENILSVRHAAQQQRRTIEYS